MRGKMGIGDRVGRVGGGGCGGVGGGVWRGGGGVWLGGGGGFAWGGGVVVWYVVRWLF